VRLVPALTGIADTYRAERSFRGEGRESLQRALQAYDTAEYPDAADQATVLIQLGDWYLLTNQREEAVDSYTRAWQVLSEEGGAEIAAKQLGKPTRLRYDDPPPEVDTAVAAAREPLFVEVQFTVKPDGTVDDAVITESNASNSVKRQVRLAVQQARYRPGFEDGKPVPMQVRIRQKYYSQEAATARAEKAPQEPGASLPSEAVSPGEAGAATGTGEGVPAGATAPVDAGGTDAGATASPPEADSGETGTTGADAPAEPTAPAAEPEPETP
jgi:TonB family protein